MQRTDSESVIKALRLSILLGPNELHYLLDRFKLCGIYFKQFEAKDYHLLGSQTLLVWKFARKPFLRFFRKNLGFFESVKILMQEKHPEILQKMVSTINKPT